MSTTERGPAAALWDLIEQKRIQKGLNVSEPARLAGVGRSTLINLPTITRPPFPATVIALARVLDIDLHDALKLVGLQAANIPPDHEAKSAGRSEMAEALRRCLPDLDDATLARVAMAMSDILQGVASQLFVEASRRQA
jgi:transcriptional regulator with XRE-family HTH domain